MTANELMIGDWVMFYGKPIQIRDMVQLRDGRYGINTEFGTMTEIDDSLDPDDFNPIPITAEILEKHGFRTMDDGSMRFFNGDEGNYYAGFSSAWYYPESKWINLTKEDNHGFQTQVKMKALYVHELQHALRLCGIEKEIEP